MTSVLVQSLLVALAVFVAVALVLVTLRLHEVLEMLGAINHAVERVAVALKKR